MRAACHASRNPRSPLSRSSPSIRCGVTDLSRHANSELEIPSQATGPLADMLLNCGHVIYPTAAEVKQ
jgi:hypothetical protein